MLLPEAFSPAERLHAALRRRAPQMAVSVVRDEGTGLPHVTVTYRDAGPKIVEWDGAAYRMRQGDGPWLPLPTDPEDAADVIAADLGAAPRRASER
ncbi:hypothetical protein [Actinomadura macra]|uniref:hypothetical protein n=1 Tax=Actinomadura macra TaxID=46164 RepID=UPI000831FC6D|nr:hypothetical protein [Actinomadura macra]